MAMHWQNERLHTPAGEMLFGTGTPASLWRLTQGVARLDHVVAERKRLYRLALPGDLMGIDWLCDLPHRFSSTAVTDCVLEPVVVQDDAQRSALLAQAVLQQQSRALDMIELRSGTIRDRLLSLLRQMGFQSDGLDDPFGPRLQALRDALPPLKVLAAIVDAESETVCRALPGLLRGARKSCGRPALSRPRQALSPGLWTSAPI